MTRPVPVSRYKAHERDVRAAFADVADKRASRNRNLLDREDACGAYMEARFWLRTFRARLAEVHPEKNCHLSPAAKARHDARHEQ